MAARRARSIAWRAGSGRSPAWVAGGGALIVIANALAGGFVLSRRGVSVARVACAVVAAPGLLLLGFLGGMAGR